VPGQAAGGSGQFEMTQDAADDRLVSDGREIIFPLDKLLSLRNLLFTFS
jgi:hypothetical protein